MNPSKDKPLQIIVSTEETAGANTVSRIVLVLSQPDAVKIPGHKYRMYRILQKINHYKCWYQQKETAAGNTVKRMFTIVSQPEVEASVLV